MRRPYLSVIIPAFNEGSTIAGTISGIRSYLYSRNITSEIIVVDDGSRDNTAEVVQSIQVPGIRLIRHSTNCGKGAAVKSGMLAATGEFRMFIDADLQIHIENLDKCWGILKEGADVVIATSPVAFGAHFEKRALLGYLAKRLIRFVMCWNIDDSQRGMKIFSESAAQQIFGLLSVNRWGFDIEALAIASARGLTIRQVAVEYDRPVVSRVSVWSYLYTLWELTKIRFRVMFGRYDIEGGNVKALYICLGVIILGLIGVLLGRFIFFDGDTIGIFYPDFANVAHMWNSGILFGFPSPASFQWGYFNPLYQLFTPHYNLLILLYVVTTGILTFTFARRLSLSRGASVFTALLFALGQSNFHWVGNLAVISSAIVVPLAFLGIRAVFYGPRWHIILYALLLGLSFLGGHQQFVVMALLAAGVYGFYLATGQYFLQRSIGSVFKAAARFIVATMAAVLIGLPQIIYTAAFTSLSTRVGGLSLAQATVEAATPIDLIKFILPGFTFRYGTTAEFLPYIGILGLIYVVIALRMSYRRSADVKFFCLFSLVLLLTTFKYSPIFFILHQLPVFDYFRGPARWTFILNFTMAILAGYGMQWSVEHWEQFKRTGTRIAGRIFAFTASLGLMGTAIYTVFGRRIISVLQGYFDSHIYATTTKLPLEYYHGVIRQIVDNSFSNIALTNLMFLLSLSAIAVTWLVIRFSTSLRRYIRLSLLMTFVALLVIGVSNQSFAYSHILTSPPAIADYILTKNPSSLTYRVFSFLSGMAGSQKISAIHSGASTDALSYGIDALMPNTNLLWRIPSIDGYEPMAPRRGQRVLAFVGSESNQTYPSLANDEILLSDKLKLFISRIAILSMLNTKYIVSAYELPLTGGVTRVMTTDATRFHVPIYLYENANALPRVYLANGITYVSESDEDTSFHDIIESDNNFSKNTFIECSDCGRYRNIAKKSDKITVREYSEGLLRLTADVGGGRWLVFSESNVPGWHVMIDGEAVRSYMANYLFHGVYIPAGQHDIEFRYVGLTLFSKLIPW